MLTTVSLETARAMKDAGYKQQSAVWWVCRKGTWYLTADMNVGYEERSQALSAPRADEILRHLPMLFDSGGKLRFPTLERYTAEELAGM